jgi:DNA (cytosine-5)-methyltransferase 1
VNKENVVLKFGELFCGPGGLALGALRAKARTVDKVYSIEHTWANDYHKSTCETYRRNICSQNPESVICCDVRKLDISSLGKIDVFAYGFPCNDFSIVGEQKGFDGEFGPLYMYGVKVIDEYCPKFFVAENVGGISSANNGLAFKKILNDLKNAGNGYNITSHLYRCEDYCVPQTRHRIIVVGVDKKLDLFYKVPAPLTENNPVTAREALEKPPIKKDAPNHVVRSASENVEQRLKRIKPGENAWTADLPKHLRLNVKGAKLSQIYKKLDPDKPSYTITGSGGGGTHGYHWKDPRALTNRERARIQTFPDDFVFEGSYGDVRRQIGMSVPPKMSQIIFTSLLKTFAGIRYPSISANMDVGSDLFKEEILEKEYV